MDDSSTSRSSHHSSVARSFTATRLFLRKQLWIWPLVAAVVLIGIGWWVRGRVEKAAKQGMAANLQAILDADVEALKLWLKTEENTAAAVAGDASVAAAVAELVKLSQGDDAAAALSQSTALATLQKDMEPWLEAHEYEGFVVVSADRMILATLDAQAHLVGDTALAQDATFLDRVFAGEPTVSVPFESAVPLKDADGEVRSGLPTMFSAAPVAGPEGDVMAALGLRIRPDETFTQILGVAQAGESGEAYAFDEDGLLLSTSRFEDQLKKIGLITDNDTSRSVLTVQIRDPQVDMTRGRQPKLRMADRPLTRMAADAVAGNSGVDVDGYRDYRGVPVVGAWTWLPDYGFGVATEVDHEEAYRPIHILRWAFWGLFGLLAAAAVAIFAFSLVVARLDRNVRRAALEVKQLGQYALDEKIGAGGMGVVYRAHHAMLQRPTAVKLLDVDKTNEDTIARFEREVRLTASLNHPNTIAIYDYGRTPEGVFYYAMEYLDGITLEHLVKQFGPQPEGRVIGILRQLCGSLAEAHAVGLIHRDVKPANVILNERGGMYDVVKLLDFGLVKAVDARQFGGLTASGSLTGTPLYMSPEAIETPRRIDARSDLYAVGGVGYFLLTGQPVFRGESVIEICAQHVQATPVPPSQRLGRTVARDLETIVLKCLAKRPADRPASAAELDDELARCQSAGSWDRQTARQWWQTNVPHDRPPAEPSRPTSHTAISETIVSERK